MKYIDEIFLLNLIKNNYDDAKVLLKYFNKYNIKLIGEIDNEGYTLFHYMAYYKEMNHIIIRYLTNKLAKSNILEIKNNKNENIKDIAKTHNQELYSFLYSKNGYKDLSMSFIEDSVNIINSVNHSIQSGGSCYIDEKKYIKIINKKVNKNKDYKEGDNKLLSRAIYQVMIDEYGKYKENKIKKILNKKTNLLNSIIINSFQV